MKKSKFSGLGVAMVTPFAKDGAVDIAALKKLTNHLCNGGADFLVVMGTTGENPVLSDTEQRQILDAVLETNAGKLPVVFGMGGNDTRALCNRISNFDFSGVDGILSASPYYNKPNQQGIYEHYCMLASQTDLPVIIYNVPGRTGSNISAETTLRLAEVSNIIATKEASGNFSQCMEIIKHKPDGFAVISGDDAYTLPFISMGMDGVISVIGNAFPTTFGKMVQLAISGNFAEARIYHYQLLDMMHTIFEDGSPGGIKVILNKLGICEEWLRLPLQLPSEVVKQKLLSQLKISGLSN